MSKKPLNLTADQWRKLPEAIAAVRAVKLAAEGRLPVQKSQAPLRPRPTYVSLGDVLRWA